MDPLAAARSIRQTLDAEAGPSEAARTLTPAAVDALWESGLMTYLNPREAGGDEPQLEAMIPPAVDVDVMSPERVTGVLNGVERLPPVTVSAALALIDAHDVRVAGRRGLVIAEPSDFAAMFRLAFVRCGVQMLPLIRPAETTLHERLREVTVVIAAAGIPGSVRANQLAPGTVAIDVGYFNPGGRGDIDINERIAHLDAIAPVPGSIGPMTVSCLVERTILFAERRIA